MSYFDSNVSKGHTITKKYGKTFNKVQKQLEQIIARVIATHALHSHLKQMRPSMKEMDLPKSWEEFL